MKLQPCPYKTGDGKCTNKHCYPTKSRRKRFCNYSDANKCELYQEWVELVDTTKLEESSILAPLNTPLQASDNKGEET